MLVLYSNITNNEKYMTWFFSGFRLVELAVDIRQSQLIVDCKIFLVNEIKESVNFINFFIEIVCIKKSFE